MSLHLYRGLRALAHESPSLATRREVLQRAIAAAGGLFAFDRSVRAQPRQSLPRVAVIGAGFAGLACADELVAAGYPVTVYEARQRTGGRVLSLTDLIPGKIVEGGGELVGPNQPTWMAYAKRFDLRFTEMPWDACDVIHFGEECLSPAAAKSLWEQMRTALEQLNALAEPIDADEPWRSPQAAEIDRRSLDDWIAALDVEPRCRELIAIQMTGINGVIPAWQSLLAILAIVRGGGLQKFWDETDTLHCVGGTQQLATRIAQSLIQRRGETAVKLGTPVARIKVAEKCVELTLAAGERVEVDEVVLTVPPSTWNKIAFDPPLPAGLTFPMAASAKYLAVFERAVWQDSKSQPNAMSRGPVQLTWETTAGQGSAGEQALVAYSGGAIADEVRSWTPAERDTRMRAALEQLYPGAAAALRRGRFVDWIADPWARGTYAMPAPGQVTSVGPLVSQPIHQRLHLAGEYMNYAFMGWMEGALAAGVRVAHRLSSRDRVSNSR